MTNVVDLVQRAWTPAPWAPPDGFDEIVEGFARARGYDADFIAAQRARLLELLRKLSGYDVDQMQGADLLLPAGLDAGQVAVLNRSMWNFARDVAGLVADRVRLAWPLALEIAFPLIRRVP
jgi:hypothetical protein